MLPTMWDWIQGLSAGGGAFLGSFLGLFAILLGALFNAWLNRRRDDRLREEERRTLAAALRAEILTFRSKIQARAGTIKKFAMIKDHEFRFCDLPGFRDPIVFRANADRIGLLGSATADRVVTFYALVDEIGDMLQSDNVISARFLEPDLPLNQLMASSLERVERIAADLEKIERGKITGD